MVISSLATHQIVTFLKLLVVLWLVLTSFCDYSWKLEFHVTSEIAILDLCCILGYKVANT